MPAGDEAPARLTSTYWSPWLTTTKWGKTIRRAISAALDSVGDGSPFAWPIPPDRTCRRWA